MLGRSWRGRARCALASRVEAVESVRGAECSGWVGPGWVRRSRLGMACCGESGLVPVGRSKWVKAWCEVVRPGKAVEAGIGVARIGPTRRSEREGFWFGECFSRLLHNRGVSPRN